MNSAAAQSLYSHDILRLTSSLPHDDRLAEPQGCATCRAPLCGSEMTVDVKLDDAGQIAAIAIRARACAMGQAAAAIVREQAVGHDKADIVGIRDNLVQILAGDSLSLAWPALEAFARARDYPARHGAILLPFETLLAAMENTQS